MTNPRRKTLDVLCNESKHVSKGSWLVYNIVRPKKGWSFLHSVEFVYFQLPFNFMKHPTSIKLTKGKAIPVQALRALAVYGSQYF